MTDSPLTRPPDPLAALARAAVRGDAAATERLFQEGGRKLIRVALALGIPSEEASDLIQDVLLAGWKSFDRFDPDQGSFVGWLSPGVRGRALNLYRGRRRKLDFLESFRGLAARRETEVGQQSSVEARLTLQRLLQALTLRQREVVALYEIGGLSSRETAEILGVDPATVRSIARDAKRRLKMAALDESEDRVDDPGALDLLAAPGGRS